ncbi:hypothetical protein AB0C28_00755 [Nonomuraea sp. NPDC048892]|uniref:hypothetical protein n=1 Tax=Nonomuraea sp. NPDC048892 TaxID=3154624 RepID=UPI003400ECBF
MHIVNEANKQIDFDSYAAFVAPALRAAAAPSLRRARHRGQACQGVHADRWCDECEQTICDLLLNGYNRLSNAMRGDHPKTKSGEPIREVQTIVQWLTTPLSFEDFQRAGRRLRQRPAPHDPPHIRAARAQLVFHELRSLEAKVARADAQAGGASAQPARDLKTADWAEPLRADGYAFELLLNAILRLRRGASDPLAIPDDLIDRAPSACRAQAERLLRNHMEMLRQARPDFYCANVIKFLYATEEISETIQSTAPSPEEVIIRFDDAWFARRKLAALIGDDGVHRSREHYRAFLRDISTTALPNGPQLVARVARWLDIDANVAEIFIRRMISLAVCAGLDWVAENCA